MGGAGISWIAVCLVCNTVLLKMTDMENELQNLKEQMKTIEITLFGPKGDNGMYKDVRDIKKIMVWVRAIGIAWILLQPVIQIVIQKMLQQ